jgi:SAM-dependent methyltransferase
MLARCAERLARLPRARQGRGTLLQADFRALPLKTRFPLILCPFNALMHLYERSDVEHCLAQVRDHLLPGGLFAFDVLMPDPAWLARDPDRRWARTRFRHPRTGQRLVYSTNHSYDPVRQVAIVRMYYEPEGDGGAAQVVHLAHRQFFPQELEALLHYAGFRIEQRYGGFDGQPLSDGSLEQVIRARVR